jgi:hypothetical protein
MKKRYLNGKSENKGSITVAVAITATAATTPTTFSFQIGSRSQPVLYKYVP